MRNTPISALIALLICLLNVTALAQSAQSDPEVEPAATVPAAAETDAPASDSQVSDEDVSDKEVSDGEESDAEQSDKEAAAKAQQATFDERLDALLAEARIEESYSETENCLYHRQFHDIDIINENMLLFSRGNQYWLNTLKHRCLGLRRDMVINLVMRGVSSLCRNDQVFANRRFDIDQGLTPSGRPTIVRATCVLGDFRPVDQTFAESLKALR